MSSHPTCKPNFLYIGVSRAGSTWLHTLLLKHPNVYVPEAKGLYFFDKEYSRGVEWYESFFQDCTSDHSAVGEITHDYIFCQEAPKRIFDYNPKMKLIVNLRDPLARIVSYYAFFSERAGWKMSGFKEFFERWPDSLEEGKYNIHLQRYLEYFPVDQICVFDFDLLASNPRYYLETLFRFLGCKSFVFEDNLLKEKIWASRKTLSKRLNRLLYAVSNLFRKIGSPHLLAKIKYSGFADKILFSSEKPDIQLTLEEREFLLRIIRPEMQNLSKTLALIKEKHGSFHWIQDY
jgi:sulfotransferase family protein